MPNCLLLSFQCALSIRVKLSCMLGVFFEEEEERVGMRISFPNEISARNDEKLPQISRDKQQFDLVNLLRQNVMHKVL